MSVGTISGNVYGHTVISITLTPAEVATVVAPAQTFTVPGLKVGDAVWVSPPAQTAGVAICNARVSAANTISIQFVNPTAGALTPAAGTHLISVVRRDQTVGRVLA